MKTKASKKNQEQHSIYSGSQPLLKNPQQFRCKNTFAATQGAGVVDESFNKKRWPTSIGRGGLCLVFVDPRGDEQESWKVSPKTKMTMENHHFQ